MLARLGVAQPNVDAWLQRPKRVVDLSQNAVFGDPEPAIKKGAGRCADWVLVAIHLREVSRVQLGQPDTFTLAELERRERQIVSAGMESGTIVYGRNPSSLTTEASVGRVYED